MRLVNTPFSFYFIFNKIKTLGVFLFSGGKGRICVQGNSVGANGPACSERRNGSRSAELCQGQACLFRYAAALHVCAISNVEQ